MSHFTTLITLPADTNDIGEAIAQALAPYQENNMGDAPKEYLKFRLYDEDTGEYHWYDSEEEAPPHDEENGWWENPNAKWDWYEIGGRWTGFFKVNGSATVHYTGRPGLMTDPEKEGYADVINKGGVDFEGMTYEARRRFVPYAIIHEGEWLAKGDMGWFGVSMNEVGDWTEKAGELILGLPDDMILAIVDCHI